MDKDDPQEIRRQLQGIRLFSDALRPDQLDELALACFPLSFPSGTVLMRQGEYGSAIYCITEGEVSITVIDALNRVNEVSRLRAGTVIGEIELLTGVRRVATATAVTDLRVLEIPRQALESLFTRSPDLIENLAATLAIRQAMLDQVVPDQRGSLKARIAARMRALFPGRLGRTSW